MFNSITKNVKGGIKTTILGAVLVLAGLIGGFGEMLDWLTACMPLIGAGAVLFMTPDPGKKKN